MLVRVSEDPRRVVCPIIDVISMENFDYIGGKFNFKLDTFWIRYGQMLLIYFTDL